MSASVTLRVALAGNPNCGKTALFNALTGGRQKVGNYPGVTVERKEGSAPLRGGGTALILDLPGTYSLDARTPDEVIARDIVLGRLAGELPEVLLAVADATNLERGLGLVLELRELGRPLVLALNMMDLAEARGLALDLVALSAELGVPVIPTVATRRRGLEDLLEAVRGAGSGPSGEGAATPPLVVPSGPAELATWLKRFSDPDAIRARFARVDAIIARATRSPARSATGSDRIDAWLLHPVFGTLALIAVLLVLFEAVFTWAGPLQDAIEAGIGALGAWVGHQFAEGPLRSLLVDGVIAGVGSVVVFVPQILLLFLFILILEDVGYMARAAFLMDRWMGKVGLHGRAFIPLLSSHACAIPGIMATRTIENPRDRLVTILVAPLTTCSARLPVYALLIAAFIPRPYQGLTMFGLYALGVVSALGMAFVFRRTLLAGPKPPLILELPSYKRPSVRSLLIGLWDRLKLFLRRAGTVILSLSILLWFLVSYPKVPGPDAGSPSVAPPITESYAGRLGRFIEPALAPIGFDWRTSIALIPGFAAREVMVSALSTVYAVEARGEGGESDEDALQRKLGTTLSEHWSLATALSLLIWYVFAPQCLSTLAVTRRETNSWRWPLFMFVYMTALAYAASFAVYRIALALGGG